MTSQEPVNDDEVLAPATPGAEALGAVEPDDSDESEPTE